MAKQHISDEHRDALAKGRDQGRAVRQYLEAIEEGSKPGRRRSQDELRTKVDGLEQRIQEQTNAAKRVELIQQRLDYEDQLSKFEDAPDFEALEGSFVDVAKEYSERKGISYTAWREAGVPAAVLKKAGVARTRRTA